MAIQKTQISDGLDGYFAVPEGVGRYPAIILFTEGLGLNSDMLDGSIQKLADGGYFGIAPDIFHGEVFDGTDREAMIAKIRSIDDDTVLDETRRTLAYLKGRSDVDSDRIGGIGFCMGGRLAFLAHSVFGFGASACYYGGGIAPVQDGLGRKPLLDRVEAMKGALLLGYGADDSGIGPDEHARIVEALSKAKKRFEFQLFANAGHAFLSPSRPSYQPDVAAEAWPLTLAFFDRHLVAQ